MNSALLVIDMQKAFFRDNTAQAMERASGNINAAADLFRKNNKPVIWIQDENKETGVILSSPGFELVDLLKPAPNEKRIMKHYWNSFNKTDLYDYLCQFNTDTVIVTGYCAEACVLSTYRGALDRDLTPVILKNAIASGSEDNKRFVENISDIITLSILKKIISE